MKATYTIVLEINNRLNYTGIFLEILEIASLFLARRLLFPSPCHLCHSETLDSTRSIVIWQENCFRHFG